MTSHDPAALRHRVCTGELSLEPLTVLHTARVPVPGASASLHILGASHAVVIETGMETLTELLTCAPPIGGESLKDSAVDLEDETVISARHGLWEVRARIWCDDRFNLSGARGGAWHGSIEHAFPASRPSLSAVTRIDWRILPVGLLVRTVHTYPPHKLAVHSETHLLRTFAR